MKAVSLAPLQVRQWGGHSITVNICVMKRFIMYVCTLAAIIVFAGSHYAHACTGIALKAADGSRIVARTVEWANEAMNCGYAIVPRGHVQKSFTPEGVTGLEFKARYGYVGIYTDYEQFVVEGVNEAGLSAGLFFFPEFGEYPQFDKKTEDRSISDLQFVSWVLSNFSSIEEVKKGIKDIRVISMDSRIGTVHWRLSEPGGRIVVLEYKKGEPVFHENPIGTFTNSPGFEFHITNLRNYVNLHAGAAENQLLGQGIKPENPLELSPLGGGSGMLGLPGDFTPPSRFVRAAFFSMSAPILPTSFEMVTQAFHILNNFDIPVGAQHKADQIPQGLPSATQFTAVTDLSTLRLYYRTAWNQNIRCLDLKRIDFSKVEYRTNPLDACKVQPVEMIFQ